MEAAEAKRAERRARQRSATRADILAAARGEFFREMGLPLLELQAQDTIFPVAECHLRYKTPARYDDVLTVEIWATLAQGARLNEP